MTVGIRPALSARPFWMAVVAYLGVTAWLAYAAWEATDGEFTYPLDDSYIHMSVARSLAESGTWGLRAGEFAGVSSSPLWTLVLATWFFVFGVSQVAPLGLNLAAGAGALWFAHRLVGRAGWSGEHALWWLAGLTLAIPLPTLAVSGMEHTLQIALTLWLTDLASSDDPRPVAMAAVAAAVVACRYEGIFVVGAVAAWCAWRRRVPVGVVMVAGALCAVAAYGFYAAVQGGLWLPNSVLVKAGAPGDVSGLAGWAVRTSGRLVGSISRQPELALAGATLVLAARSQSAAGPLVPAFALTSLLHAVFVPLRVFFRYEAVLVGLGVLAVADRWPGRGGGRRLAAGVAAVFVAIAGIAVSLRAIEAIARTPDASRNVYEQQRQMARFLSEFGEATVALNDIGAVSFFSSARLVDLAGLATPEVTRLRMRGELDTAAIDRIARAHGATVAVLYPDYFTGQTALPASWVRVEEWRIENRTSAAFDTVAFYATSPGEVPGLAARLDRFRPSLPPQVRVEP